MKIKCTGCGKIEEGDGPRFCIVKAKDGLPCGSVMIPFIEASKPRKEKDTWQSSEE
jgi:hypothetical protein